MLTFRDSRQANVRNGVAQASPVVQQDLKNEMSGDFLNDTYEKALSLYKNSKGLIDKTLKNDPNALKIKSDIEKVKQLKVRRDRTRRDFAKHADKIKNSAAGINIESITRYCEDVWKYIDMAASFADKVEDFGKNALNEEKGAKNNKEEIKESQDESMKLLETVMEKAVGSSVLEYVGAATESAIKQAEKNIETVEGIVDLVKSVADAHTRSQPRRDAGSRPIYV